MIVKRLFAIFILLFLNACLFGQSIDSLLVIQQPNEVFALNPYTAVFKDYAGSVTYDQVRDGTHPFVPITEPIYSLNQDRAVDTYWFRMRIDNQTHDALNYVIYFHPGLDTVEYWVNRSVSADRVVLSSLAYASSRPLHITQELCAPLRLLPGANDLYVRVPNHSKWNKELGSMIASIALESTFINYFLSARSFHSFALGLISIIVILHFVIYLFLRERSFLLLAINLFFTLFYLVLLKNVQAEWPLSTTQLSAMRYWLSPMGYLVCASSLVFIQTFLDTRLFDSRVNRLIKYCVGGGLVILIFLIFFQAFQLIEVFTILYGLFTYLLVVVVSIRAYRKGNVIAPYIFFGYLLFFLPIYVFIFPLSFSDFRSNESDLFYLAEATRSIVFAVGVADRFWRAQRNANRSEQEKKQLSIDNLLILKAQRERIMQDLHDNLGGQLSSISIGLNQLARGNKNLTVESIQRITERAVTELRNSLWIIDKESISLGDMEQRINNLFWQYRKIAIPIELHGAIPDCDKDTKLSARTAGNIYRIIQEATHNAVKHSNAHNFTIKINVEGEQLNLFISDDGIGFEEKDISAQEHYGVENMKLRARQIGAAFTLVTNAERGTTITLKVPVDV